MALLELGLRVDELEQGLAPVLEGLPTRFCSPPSSESRTRRPQSPRGGAGRRHRNCDVDSDHPLVGTWAVADEMAAGVPGLVIFTAEGTVVVVSPGGGTGPGAWAPTGPRTAVAVWLLPSAGRDREGNVTVLRSQITLDATGATVVLAYEVLQVTARGGVAERSQGTVTGVRISIPTPEPVSPTLGP